MISTRARRPRTLVQVALAGFFLPLLLMPRMGTALAVPRAAGGVAPMAPLAGVTATSAGDGYTCALKSDTSVRCWGLNNHGQLGDGTTEDRLLPVTVLDPSGTGPLIGVTQLDAGTDDYASHSKEFTGHTCAALMDGSAVCWGYNHDGQLGDGTTTDRNVPVVVKNPSGNGSLEGVTQVTTGGNTGIDGPADDGAYTCARLADGRAACWGANFAGELGDGTTSGHLLPTIVQSETGEGALTAVETISAGGSHTCAVLADATVRCWGYNNAGQIGNGDIGVSGQPGPLLPVPVESPDGTGPLADVAEVSAGQSHTCARVTDGSALCWGRDSNGQLGNDTDSGSSPLPTTVVDRRGPLTSVASIDTGGLHTCALIVDGTMRCWGRNREGEVGDGTTSKTRQRAIVVRTSAGGAALDAIEQFSAGGGSGRSHNCAVRASRLLCWGYNADGELGDGTTTTRLVPVQVRRS